MNKNRNITLAAKAIAVKSIDNARIIIIIPEIIVETNGVLYLECILLKTCGRLYCVPIAKLTLLAANVVAFSAESVDTSPPASTISAPNGKKYSADSIIPNSPKLPMNSHAGIPIVDSFNPPMKTNVNKI